MTHAEYAAPGPDEPGEDAFHPLLVQDPDALKQWVVLHVRPRCEKKLDTVCRQQGIDHYLPLRTRIRRYQGRKRITQLPLFSGYVFSRATPEHQQWLAQNRYVANLLPVLDEAPFLRQLQQVDLALRLGQVFDPLQMLAVGKRVRIVTGPLMGVEGVIQHFRGHTRVLLNVDLIDQSVPVEINAEDLEPVDGE